MKWGKMIRELILSLILAVCFVNTTYAKQVKVANDGDEVKVTISLSELNRIKVEGDRISSLKANQGDLEILEESKLGEIYIKPLHNNKEIISLFITTKKGKTYKLSLDPQDTAAEQIFITKKPVGQEVKAKLSPSKILQKFQKDNKGVNLSKIKPIKQISVEGYELDLIKSKAVGDYISELLIYKNEGDFFADLSPEDFLAEKRASWLSISIDNKNPSVGDISTIYVVRKKS
jgi:hypothetical protein